MCVCVCVCVCVRICVCVLKCCQLLRDHPSPGWSVCRAVTRTQIAVEIWSASTTISYPQTYCTSVQRTYEHTHVVSTVIYTIYVRTCLCVCMCTHTYTYICIQVVLIFMFVLSIVLHAYLCAYVCVCLYVSFGVLCVDLDHVPQTLLEERLQVRCVYTVGWKNFARRNFRYFREWLKFAKF